MENSSKKTWIRKTLRKFAFKVSCGPYLFQQKLEFEFLVSVLSVCHDQRERERERQVEKERERERERERENRISDARDAKMFNI